jgi:hypothetical protein
MADRRRNSRHPVPANAFAALGRGFTKVGKIQDISERGLAFDYIVVEGPPGEDEFVDIFMADNAFHLRELPCRIVYEIDVDTPRMSDSRTAMLTKRRCGIRFSDVGERHHREIKMLIDFWKMAGNDLGKDAAKPPSTSANRRPTK